MDLKFGTVLSEYNGHSKRVEIPEEVEYISYGAFLGSYVESKSNTNKNIHVLSILKEFKFTKECIDKVKSILERYEEEQNDECFVGGDVFNAIMEEFYDDNTSVIDRFYVMSMLVQCTGLTIEDQEGFKYELKTLRKALREEDAIRETDQFVAEDGTRFESMSKALGYTKTTPYDQCYIIDKVNCETGRLICRYWYNQELEMIAYDYKKI